MSDKSNIEWTDATWNPVTGCTEVSPGCAHCYAKTFAERWRGVPGNYFENGFDVQLRPNMLERPLHWTRPRRIFVNSMSDLFHEDVPDEYIDRCFAVMGMADWHTYQILTKRIERAERYLSEMPKRLQGGPLLNTGVQFRSTAWPLPNVLIGPTVENQHFADVRLPILAQIHDLGWRTMVSYEPALGPVDFTGGLRHFSTERFVPRPGGYAVPELVEGCIDWLICGGESGPKHRPFYVEWARSARDQARDAGVPFFMKQLGGARPGTALEDLPEDLRVREFPL